VIAGFSSIRVSWTAPAGNGVDVIGYKATASPGPATCSTTGVTNCVLGGEAGTSYTVTVVAYSSGGSSPASAASSAVTPTAPEVATSPPDTDLPLNTGDGDVSSIAPGAQIVVKGDGYAPYSSVTITVYSSPIVLATVTTDEQGAFEESVTAPASLSTGTHSFVAAGVDPDGNVRALRLDLTVANAGSGGGGGSLPVTGGAVMWLFLTGFAITLTGFAMRTVRDPRPRDQKM
jgi:hypothetical protein